MNISTTTRKQNRGRKSNILRKQDPENLGLGTTLVTGPSDPDVVTPDMVMRKKVLIRLDLSTRPSATGYEFLINPGVLANGVFTPGGNPFYVRLIKLSVYGEANSPDTIAIQDSYSDRASFTDTGVFGQSRANIHIRPSLQMREQWFPSDSTVQLYNGTVFNAAGETQATAFIQATLEVRIRGNVLASNTQ